MYLCTKIKQAFSCGWECGGLESLSVTHNLSWTKSAIIELSLHRLNPVSNDCLHYLYDQAGRILRRIVMMLTEWSFQWKAEILQFCPCHWIWKLFMRNQKLL